MPGRATRARSERLRAGPARRPRGGSQRSGGSLSAKMRSPARRNSATSARVDGATRPEGRNQGHSPRPLRPSGELAALKADAYHWLTDPEYAVLKHCLEYAHAALEAALVEARRRVRINEERPSE